MRKVVYHIKNKLDGIYNCLVGNLSEKIKIEKLKNAIIF